MHISKNSFRDYWVIMLLLVPTLLCSCSDKSSPEEQINRFIAAGKEAAQARDAGKIKDLISEQYGDDKKRNKRALVRLTAGYFLRHKEIHIFTRKNQLTFPAPDRAELQLFVAMGGLPMTEAASLLDVRADLYRFDLFLLKEEDSWKLVAAKWWPATKNDFFEKKP